MEHSSQAWTLLFEMYDIPSLKARQSTSLSKLVIPIQDLVHLRYGLSDHPKDMPTRN